MRTHMREKSFLCGKSWKEVSNIEYVCMHQKLHMDNNPNACNYCRHGFCNAVRLVIHMKGETATLLSLYLWLNVQGQFGAS